MRNWMRVREARLDFPDSGLVIVSGTIGSGKTSLGEAISRTLLGVQGRYTNLGWYSLDERGNTYVNLLADLDGEQLVVELGYKCDELSKTGEGLRWRLGKRLAVERGHVRETRAELSALLITSLLAEWSVYMDGKTLDFSRLGQADAVQLLQDALDQPPWDKYHEVAKRQLAQDEADLEAAIRRHSTKQSTLADLDTAVVDAKRLLLSERAAYEKNVAAYRTELARLSTEQTDLQGQLEKLKLEHDQISADLKKTVASTGEEYKQAELDLSRLKSGVQEGRRLVSAWEDASEQAWKLRQEAERDLSALLSVPDKCPTCGKEWDKVPTKEEIEEARARVQAQKEACSKTRESVDKAVAYEKRQREKLDTAQRNLELEKAGKVDAFSKRLEALELERGRVHHKLQQVQTRLPQQPSDSAVRTWEGRLVEREASLATAKTDLEKAANDRVTAERRAALSKYWVKGLGPAGIPNLVLRHAIAPLNEAAEAVSLAMSDGLLKVVFSTEAELASGESRPKLNVVSNVKFGAKRLGGNSKGESGLINLVIAEAQAFVGRVFDRIGYRWLDEVVNSQHQQVHRRVYQYMRQQANERKILIFVVDHSPDIHTLADHTLVVEKDADGYTNYRWA